MSQGLARLPRTLIFFQDLSWRPSSSQAVLSRQYSCGYPIGISLQVLPWCHLTSDRHFFSRPLVASLEFSGGLSRHYSCGYPIGISLQVLPWCHLTSDRHFFSRPLRGVSRVSDGIVRFSCGHPIGIYFQVLPWRHFDTRLAFLFKTSPWHLSSSRMVSSGSLVDTRWAFLLNFILLSLILYLLMLLHRLISIMP
jgi:hypothetical protein